MQLVQQKTAGGVYDGNSVNQPKVILDNTPLSGSLLIVILTWNSFGINVSEGFDTNISTNFTTIQENITGGSRQKSLYRITTSASETKTYQGTLDTANHGWAMAVFEFKNVVAVSPADQIAPAAGSASDVTTVATGTTGTTAQASEHALAFVSVRIYNN